MTKKCTIRIDEVHEDGTKNHYKSITIPRASVTVWRALKAAFLSMGLDLERIRQQRIRRGGMR